MPSSIQPAYSETCFSFPTGNPIIQLFSIDGMGYIIEGAENDWSYREIHPISLTPEHAQVETAG